MPAGLAGKITPAAADNVTSASAPTIQPPGGAQRSRNVVNCSTRASPRLPLVRAGRRANRLPARPGRPLLVATGTFRQSNRVGGARGGDVMDL
jgi:hypothetical protein